MMVNIERCENYEKSLIDRAMLSWGNLFSNVIHPGDVVILKPNWIAESHKYKKDEWEQVITHPLIISSVLGMVLKNLKGQGRVIITDGPMTGSSWKKLMEIMNPSYWVAMGRRANVNVTILDLRDDEWSIKGDLIVKRRKMKGDPLGSVICNLGYNSEFLGKKVGKYGFFGADYNQKETNQVHSNENHYYKVSRSVIEADVFINLPKLKTHKKAGITCSLKNLVGINTYKNWLPHHTGGSPSEGGDQFPEKNLRNFAEGSLTRMLYDFLANKPQLSKFFIPVKRAGKIVFGDTRDTIRSGSWYGNDTLWRMVLDLNKILLYANSDGRFREDTLGSRKRYISIVDAVISGEGNGPDAPDKKDTGLIMFGTDPVSVDAVCAKMMGFDWEKIPIIKNAFSIRNYSICEGGYDSIFVKSSIEQFNKPLRRIVEKDVFHFLPSVGWKGHIECRANHS